MVPVKCFVDYTAQPRSNLWLVAVPDRLHKQFTERTVVEGELPENVEHLTA